MHFWCICGSQMLVFIEYDLGVHSQTLVFTEYDWDVCSHMLVFIEYDWDVRSQTLVFIEYDWDVCSQMLVFIEYEWLRNRSEKQGRGAETATKCRQEQGKPAPVQECPKRCF